LSSLFKYQAKPDEVGRSIIGQAPRRRARKASSWLRNQTLALFQEHGIQRIFIQGGEANVI
jgi:hypothetical protein